VLCYVFGVGFDFECVLCVFPAFSVFRARVLAYPLMCVREGHSGQRLDCGHAGKMADVQRHDLDRALSAEDCEIRGNVHHGMSSLKILATGSERSRPKFQLSFDYDLSAWDPDPPLTLAYRCTHARM
jgi:hypothetical protein